MTVGHEARQQAQPGGRARGFHVDEHIGRRHRFAHGRSEARGHVEFVDLQHRVDEVDERKTREVFDAVRDAVLIEIAAGAVETEAVVAEPDRLGATHLRCADHDLQIDAGALLRRQPRGRDDLDRDTGMPTLHLCRRGRSDVRTESVGGRYADDAFESSWARRGDRTHGGLDGLRGLECFTPEVSEFPPTGGAGQYAPADRVFERRDAPRDGGVVDAELLGCRGVPPGSAHCQQNKQIVRARAAATRIVHICIFADSPCASPHCGVGHVHEYSLRIVA